MKVLIILGHPRTASLCGAMASAYGEGARRAGADVRRLDLATLGFDPNVRECSPRQQPLEEGLARARALIVWADHLVFVYPTWWGSTPALLKGFIDRAMTEGFSFHACEGGTGYQGLLGGRSAQLITTMDTPPLVHRFIYGQPGRRAMAGATLGFCGVNPVRYLAFGPVKDADSGQRQRWIERVRLQGRRLRHGRRTPAEWLGHKTGAWLKAMRLQFYPMTWIAYAMGALAAAPPEGALGSGVFWLGYLCLFSLEVATVLVNDVVDFQSDRRNRFFSTFTGGSRVLVDGLLSLREVQAGIGAALGMFALATGWLLAWDAAALAYWTGALAALAVLALGYTASPLKLSYRGLGELDVALTHSIGVLLCGFMFAGGDWRDPLPWLLSVPLLLAIFPSIILSGIPDMQADEAAGKGTLAVRLGQRGALMLALGFTVLAVLAAAAWQFFGLAGGAYAGTAYAAVPHGAWLAWRIGQRLKSGRPPGRIDGLMAISLTFLLWFGLVPLVRLW
ncbi:MAG: ycaK [Polaromonas sp.]|nr:ycaK [Polaromonas sp.]